VYYTFTEVQQVYFMYVMAPGLHQGIEATRSALCVTGSLLVLIHLNLLFYI